MTPKGKSNNFELKESIASLLLNKIRRGLYKKVISRESLIK